MNRKKKQDIISEESGMQVPVPEVFMWAMRLNREMYRQNLNMVS